MPSGRPIIMAGMVLITAEISIKLAPVRTRWAGISAVKIAATKGAVNILISLQIPGETRCSMPQTLRFLVWKCGLPLNLNLYLNLNLNLNLTQVLQSIQRSYRISIIFSRNSTGVKVHVVGLVTQGNDVLVAVDIDFSSLHTSIDHVSIHVFQAICSFRPIPLEPDIPVDHRSSHVHREGRSN